MVISEIDYHLVLLLSIEDFFEPKMKSDLALIIPDALVEHRATVKRLDIAKNRIHLHITAPPDAAPKKIVEDLMWQVSLRLIRVNPTLKGFSKIFLDSFFIKSGAKPTKAQVDNFVTLINSGI